MEIAGDDGAVEIDEWRVAGVSRAVDSRAGETGLAAFVLHDVQLATGRPAYRVDVVAEQPEGGPQSLPGRELDPRFDLARCDQHLAARRDFRGRIQAGTVVARQ